MTERFRIGIISSVHGVRGEAKVYVTSDDPERYRLLNEVLLLPPGEASSVRPGRREPVTVEIERVRFSGTMALVKFRGIDTPEEMRKYQGMELWIPREQALPLEEGEFYIADLLGLTVVTEEGEELGTVKDIWPTGANHVITVRQKSGREVLLPYIPDCVKEVLPEEGIIRIHLMEGLL